MGLLNFDDPDSAGMMGIAQGLLSASGPSRMPVSLGQALGAAAGQGQESYAQAQRLKMMQAQAAMQQIQMQMIQKQLATKEAMGKALQEAAMGNPAQTIPQTPQLPPNTSLIGNSLIGDTGSQSVPLGTVKPSDLNYQSTPMGSASTKAPSAADVMMAAALKAGDYDSYNEAMKMKLEEKKVAPKFAQDFKVAIGADGKLHNYQLADNGDIKEVSLGVKPEIVFEDLGGTKIAVDKNAVTAGKSFSKTQTPDSLASNNLTRRGQDLQYGLNAEGKSALESEAQAIASGQLPPPTGMSATRPQTAALMKRVMEINPSYDYTTVTAKKNAAAAFTAGQQGNAMRSIATANDHLTQLGELADALGNGDLRAINKVKNWYGAQTGNTNATNFDSIKNVVGQEVVKAIVSNGGSEGERQDAAKAFDSAKSPAQLKGVIEHYRMVMGAQLNNLMEQRRAAGLPDSTLPSYVANQKKSDVSGDGWSAIVVK